MCVSECVCACVSECVCGVCVWCFMTVISSSVHNFLTLSVKELFVCDCKAAEIHTNVPL